MNGTNGIDGGQCYSSTFFLFTFTADGADGTDGINGTNGGKLLTSVVMFF